MHTTTNSLEHNLVLTYEITALEVGERLRRAADELGRNKRILAFYLADMEERRLYLVSGHGSTAHFAEAQLEMDPRRTREYMQVGRSLRNLELVDQAFCDGAIGWSKVCAMLPVVQRETQRGWVDYAMTHTFREVREEAAGCRPGDLPGEGDDYGLIHKKVTIQARLDDVHYRMFEQARIYFSRNPETLLTDDELIVELLRRALSAAPLPNHPVPDALGIDTSRKLPMEERNHDGIPTDVRERVLRRDDHRCRNCRNHLDVEVHHIVFRSLGGSNQPSNLVVLCPTCHAGVHRGFLQIHGDPNATSLSFTSSYSGSPIDRGVRTPSGSDLRQKARLPANAVG